MPPAPEPLSQHGAYGIYANIHHGVFLDFCYIFMYYSTKLTFYDIDCLLYPANFHNRGESTELSLLTAHTKFYSVVFSVSLIKRTSVLPRKCDRCSTSVPGFQ